MKDALLPRKQPSQRRRRGAQAVPFFGLGFTARSSPYVAIPKRTVLSINKKRKLDNSDSAKFGREVDAIEPVQHKRRIISREDDAEDYVAVCGGGGPGSVLVASAAAPRREPQTPRAVKNIFNDADPVYVSTPDIFKSARATETPFLELATTPKSAGSGAEPQSWHKRAASSIRKSLGDSPADHRLVSPRPVPPPNFSLATGTGEGETPPSVKSLAAFDYKSRK